MSKHMQLSITVVPYYETDIEGVYPRLASLLRRLEPNLLSQDSSLYQLAGNLDLLLYHSDGTALRPVLLKHKDEVKTLHKTIEKNIADRNLAQADKLLYRIEDIFDEIESALD